MVKIGLVDVTTSHADAFSKIFNVEKKFKGFAVTKCWDVDEKRSKEVAQAYGLEAVPTLKDMKNIDAVMVLSRDANRHLPYLTPFLKKGLPAFVDKTTAYKLSDAEKMFRVARAKKIPLFSASAVRFAREIEEAKQAMAKMGKVLFIEASGPGELLFYGQHLFDAIYALVGRGATQVRNVGDEKISIIRLDFASGLVASINISDYGHVPFAFTVADEKTCHRFEVKDHVYYYSKMMECFVNMVKGAAAPIDPFETVEIIDAMLSAKKSREKGGKPVKLKGTYKI
jgi:predicted dehydrogenase